MSAEALAEEAGISRNYVTRIEAGLRPMSDSVAPKIYGALGFTPEEVPFTTWRLVEKCRDMICACKSDEPCRLPFKQIGKVIYFTDISLDMDTEGLETRLSYAYRLLVHQEYLYD